MAVQEARAAAVKAVVVMAAATVEVALVATTEAAVAKLVVEEHRAAAEERWVAMATSRRWPRRSPLARSREGRPTHRTLAATAGAGAAPVPVVASLPYARSACFWRAASVLMESFGELPRTLAPS